MSNKGIFTALSGAMAQSARLDTIANNIANANTNSFKKDKQTFYEYLTANEKLPETIQVPKVPASIESFYDMQGGDRGYVDSSGSFTDFTQGQLKPTGNPFDLAIEGSGFYEVLTPQGVQLTRNGSFKLGPNNQLVNHQGYPILSNGNGDPAQRLIRIESPNITISYSGEIYEKGELKGQLSVIDVQNKEVLQKVGASNYKFKNNSEPLVSTAVAKVHQGFIETSNVNIVNEMTEMISATRGFESTQKTIQAFDQMNQRLVNDVGKVN